MVLILRKGAVLLIALRANTIMILVYKESMVIRYKMFPIPSHTLSTVRAIQETILSTASQNNLLPLYSHINILLFLFKMSEYLSWTCGGCGEKENSYKFNQTCVSCSHYRCSCCTYSTHKVTERASCSQSQPCKTDYGRSSI